MGNPNGRLRNAVTGQLVAGLLILAVIIVVFQNCAGYQPAFNPLYDRAEPSSCVGASCEIDVNSAQIQVMNVNPITLKKTVDGVVPGTCNLSSCFEVSGYCDAGGFTKSVFYVELQNLISRTRLSQVSCDALGRFKFMVQVPTTFNYGQIYNLVVTMAVIDESGVERENPLGLHRKEISVTGRIDPTPTPAPAG